MEDFKKIVKSVLDKFSDKKENPCLSVRMSEINVSITSDIYPPQHSSTLKLTSDDDTQDDTFNLKNENLITQDAIKNSKVNIEVPTEISIVKINNNNNIIMLKNNCTDLSEMKDDSKNKLPKLKIINNKDKRNSQILNVVNNLSKEQSISEKNIAEFMVLMKAKELSSSTAPSQNKPIMGRAALLKRANVERNDSLIIHELITNRYNPILNHYYNRMYQRRISKLDSSEDEYSDTVFSSPPDCTPSPVSVSSIDTANSNVLDGRNVFSFPRNAKEKHNLQFLKSTDDVNIDTTAEDLDTSSLTSSAFSNDKSTTSFSEYDPKKFLETAIGEVTNISSESGIANDETESKNSQQKTDYSVGTSDVSSLISRASCLYNSMKKSFKRNSIRQRTVSLNGNQSVKNNRQSITANNSLLDNLMRELSVQNEILFQVSKALDYCRTMKGFETSIEFIEAEKILLVASCTKAALTKEIENIDDDTYEKKDDPRSCGEICLSNFKFFSKDGFKTNTCRELTEKFVVILACGSTVLASDVIVADENGILRIEKSFEFKKLATDFEILVYIYAMRVPDKPHYNQDHGNCPSPKKFFFNKVSRKYKVTNESSYIKPSSFLLWGKSEIRNSDLSKIKTSKETCPSIMLKMNNFPLSSTLSGMFSVNITSSVKLSNKISGFLTIGLDNEHGCTIWNRRWCVLEGTILKYWNYPSEEITNPLGSLNLNYCLDQKVSMADRTFCARPRTIMVPVKYKENEKKYLLSADNISDLKQWENELNYVVKVLSTWNCRGAKIP